MSMNHVMQFTDEEWSLLQKVANEAMKRPGESRWTMSDLVEMLTPSPAKAQEQMVNELPSVTKIREEMQSDDPVTRMAAQAAYGVYCDAVRQGQMCPECGWNYGYHDDGNCPTPEQQASLLKGNGTMTYRVELWNADAAVVAIPGDLPFVEHAVELATALNAAFSEYPETCGCTARIIAVVDGVENHEISF